MMDDRETKMEVETPYELLKDDQKKQLSKNNKAKMTLYNALPHKEYERVFMCKTAKEVWHTPIINHQVSQDLMLLAKVTTVEEAKDLATLPLNELIGNLKGNHLGMAIDLVMVLIGLKEAVEIGLGTKEVKALDKGEVVIIAGKKATSIVSVQSLRCTRPLLEELELIVKTMTKLKITPKTWRSRIGNMGE
ncbi:hypothetical protein Tco_1022949 [Tanacetum coccineum]